MRREFVFYYFRGGKQALLRMCCHLTFLLAIVVLLASDSQQAWAAVAPTNSATIYGRITDSSGGPIANATVTLSAPGGPATRMEKTDSKGQFAFVGVPFGTYRISATAADLGTASVNVTIEGDTNVAIVYAPKQIGHITVSANARFNVTPASITQVNPIAATFQGQTSWRQLMEQIPGIAQAGLGNGAINFSDTPDSPFVPVQIAINGALPYETATLLDGMPLLGGSATSLAGTGTNLALYPLNGFGATDIVRGPGANSPSIVDSIGGSLLLHPPGSVSRNRFEFSISTDPYGGTIENSLSALRLGKFSLTTTYGNNSSPGPALSAGLTAQATGFFVNTVDGQPFSPDANYYVPVGTCPNYVGAFCSFSVDFLQCCFRQTAAWYNRSGSVDLTFAPSSFVSAEVFYAGSVSDMPDLYTELFSIDFEPPVGYTGSISPGLRNLSYGGGDGATPVHQASSLLEEKLTAQLGEGTFRIAALQNKTWGTQSNDLFKLNTTALQTNFYGTGLTNGIPTLFNGEQHSVTYCFVCVGLPDSANFLVSSYSSDLLFGYTASIGPNIRAGASYVTSRYYNYGYLNNAFGTTYFSFPIFSSNNTERTDELRFFIGGNPSPKTSLDLSVYTANARYHVPDPNNTTQHLDKNFNYTAPRVGFVWRPTPPVAIRASAGGGFAEAPLQDLVGSNGVPQLDNPPTSYSVTRTNVDLQPEKSFSFDVGTDIQLDPAAVLSFDLYRSNLFGQIYSFTGQQGTFTGSAGTLPLFVTQFGNLGLSRYEGLLLSVRRDITKGVYWSASGGLTRGYVVSLPAGFYDTARGTCDFTTGTNCRNVTVVPNINFNGTFAASIPYAQGLATFGYKWKHDTYAELVTTYYGHNNTYFRPAFAVLNGNVGYAFSEQVSLIATIRNITNVYGSPVIIRSADNLAAAPTVAGPPYALFSQMYGPRALVFTAQFKTP